MATAAAAASTAEMKHARHHQRPRISTKIETISFRYPDTANAIRLVSPPGLGALACGELWAGGKYKRHKSAALGNDVNGLGSVEQHRFTLLPDFDADGGRVSLRWRAMGDALLCMVVVVVVVVMAVAVAVGRRGGVGVRSTTLGRLSRGRSGSLWALGGLRMGGGLLSCGRA